MDFRKQNKLVITAIIVGAIVLIAASFVYCTFFAAEFQTEKKAYVYIDRDDTADSIMVKVEQAGMPRSMKTFRWLMNNLDDAKDYIKTLAPWIKDEQIEYDSDIHPVGVFGAHTPFPPFHWKCRTTTHIWTA